MVGSGTWSPLSWLYSQVGLNYVLNETTTPVSNSGSGSIVQDSENDYWATFVTTGLARDAKTDLQATYSYTRADNYQDNSSVSQPYGAGFEEHGVSASLSRKLRQGLIWTLRYGFYKSRDQATAGETDYTAHLVYSSMVYRF